MSYEKELFREQRWERRANKLNAIRNRMPMSGRGLITTAPGVAARPVRVAKKKLGRRR